MSERRFLGIVVTPANVQDEGLEAVMDNISRSGATAIALDPWLLRASTPKKGSRVPDLHIDGWRRLLGRPLWGKRELYVESFLAYEPDERLYDRTSYKPPKTAVPPELDRAIPCQLIEEAHRRGLAAHMGIAPLLPPGLSEDDRPVMVNGRPLPPPYIAPNGCLNRPSVRAYGLAAVEDLVRHYPAIDGLILDWAEFGAYRLEEHFTCFCAACEGESVRLGYDWNEIRRDVLALWEALHFLTPRRLGQARRLAANPLELVEALVAYPGIAAFLRFKADCVVSFYRQVRSLLDNLGHTGMSLSARGWCSPWNRSSGMDYRRLAKVCTAVLPKLFTFDHAVLPRWIGQTLQDWNPELAEGDILETVKAWLNLPDDIEQPAFAHYNIPAPDEEHPARMAAYQTRLEETVDQVNGRAACYPIAHPYLPDHQWQEMVALIRDSPVDGMWVNFYSYLTDRKFEIMTRSFAACQALDEK